MNPNMESFKNSVNYIWILIEGFLVKIKLECQIKYCLCL